MKQCPQCRSIFSDDTLNYCLADGTVLVPMPVGDDTPTVVHDYPAAPETRIIEAPHPTLSVREVESGKPILKYIALAAAGLVLLALAGVGAWSLLNSNKDGRSANTARPAETPVPSSGRAAPNNEVANRGETPTPSKSPSGSPTQTPKSLPEKDQGTGRITFSKGSVGQTVNGSIVSDRTFVLRTMEGQRLSATVNSPGGCVTFEGAGTSTSFTTSGGDTSLTILNTCDDPTSFTLKVTVK